MGLFALIPVALWLPETLDPAVLEKHKEKKRGITFFQINPFRSLELLRSPNIIIVVSIQWATVLSVTRVVNIRCHRR